MTTYRIIFRGNSGSEKERIIAGIDRVEKDAQWITFSRNEYKDSGEVNDVHGQCDNCGRNMIWVRPSVRTIQKTFTVAAFRSEKVLEVLAYAEPTS